MFPWEKIKWEYEEYPESGLALLTSTEEENEPWPRPDLKPCIYNKH
jgi:hypothetical protein